MIKKYKVGTVQDKKDKSGTTVAVGNPHSKNAKFRTNVEIIVFDDDGNVLAKATNGYLKIEDPRQREGADVDKIPAWIKKELYLVVDDGK